MAESKTKPKEPEPRRRIPRSPEELPTKLPHTAAELELVSLYYARRRLAFLRQYDLTLVRKILLTKDPTPREALLKGPKGGDHAAKMYYRRLREGMGPDRADIDAREVVAPADQTDAANQIATSLVDETRAMLDKFLASPEGRDFCLDDEG